MYGLVAPYVGPADIMMRVCVTDGQGLTTTVALNQVRRNVQLDPGLFVVQEAAGGGSLTRPTR